MYEDKKSLVLDFKQEIVYKTIKSSFYIKKNKVLYKDNLRWFHLWGPVGRGKSMIIGKIFREIDIDSKTRFHYQHLMKEIHKNIFFLNKNGYRGNSAKEVISKIVKTNKVIYIDEFFVEDIADIMIINLFLSFVYKYKRLLFLTSNFDPLNIYSKNIKSDNRNLISENLLQNSKVIGLDNSVDYRKEDISNKTFLFESNIDRGYDFLFKKYVNINNINEPVRGSIIINGRLIDVEGKSDITLWITFCNLCETNRSYLDYIEIVSKFKVVLLQDIPKFDLRGVNNHREKDSLRRFISFIDEAYERSIILYANFQSSIDDLVYTNDSKIKNVFIRTQSRLYEMMKNIGA
ncbi:ATPase [Francisella sp. W12-1067]|nr:ATPase [Francisella sp. W12-1067]